MSCKICKDRDFTSKDPATNTSPADPNRAAAASPTFEGFWTGYTNGPFGRKTKQAAEFQIRISSTGRVSGHYANLHGGSRVQGEITQSTVSGNELTLSTTYVDGVSTAWTLRLLPDGSIEGKWHQQGMFRGNVYLRREGSTGLVRPIG